MDRIIPFEEQYRDDLIFMILEAKNALGVPPRLREDLLDIRRHYLEPGDMFWLAIDESDRVVGSVGCRSIEGTQEIWLHRLFVKYSRKRQGIGTRLLQTAEDYARGRGKTLVRVHLGGPREQWFESYQFYPKFGYVEYAERYMKKEL